MSFSLNKAFLLGNLGRDAETTYTPGGKAITKFSVATERSWKAQGASEWTKETTWTNVVMWGNEKLAGMLRKGSKVHVEGRISTRSYDDKDGNKKYVTEVIADNVILTNGAAPNSGPDGYSGGGDFGEDVRF